MVSIVHKPVLIVIAGPNGSGKTTITSRILQHEWMENALYINPDQIAKDKFGDWNSQEAIMQSVKYCEQISRYYKSILNCRRASMIADRTYIYDNSIDDQEARLLFRMVDGKVFKRYYEEMPEWVHTIIS